MSEKEKVILKLLKNKLPNAAFWQLGQTETDQCVYYLRMLKDNLKEDYTSPDKMGYSKKDTEPNRWGVIPMAALRSSAALIYNILGDGNTCKINVAALESSKEWNLISRDYQLDYEWKYRTINRAKANVDAYLHIDNCHLFIEMKMLEPFMKTHPFDSYSTYMMNSDCPQIFKDKFDYYETTKPEYFDACQMIKHLLAIYNYFKQNKNKFQELQYVVLLNCHWEPQSLTIEGKSFEDIYCKFDENANEFEKMKDDFQDFFDKENINVNLVLAHCNHRDLKKLVGKENDKYLERYEI